MVSTRVHWISVARFRLRLSFKVPHSPTLNLDLCPWPGTFRSVEAVWLRWFTPEGEMLPTEAEAARQHAEAVQQRADAERQRAERLAERLRQLGVNPGSF